MPKKQKTEKENTQNWQIICDVCGGVLDQAGGLLFSPPDKQKRVHKKHICATCYWWLDSEIIGATVWPDV